MDEAFEKIKNTVLKRKDLDQERIMRELSLIEKYKLEDTFCNLFDLKKRGNENKVNSLVAYAAGITSKPPVGEFAPNLKFESARIGLPDIDMDFTDRRRDEVIKYVGEKYGHDHVAQIITFGTMAARAVIRDVGRALGYQYSFCDQLAKMVPTGFSLEESLDGAAEFKEKYDSDEQARRLIDLAKKLEGCARHASTHACGVVIAADPLTDSVALQHPTQGDESIVTQFEMHAIEDLGLLKMDFLGLKNLTIIEDTLARIYVLHDKLKIDLDKIPYNDPLTYNLLREALTIGVFQLESSGMQNYLKQLKPSVFEDIVAMVALYRPGPMQFIPDYIARKNGKQKIEYLHPKLEPILKDTQGICIFQEQLMQISKQLCGFTSSEADVLRKAVGKKIKELLDAQEKKFIDGAVNNGIGRKTAIELWKWILPFASYGFNKSHSAAYALIAYQTAYLKAHYPVEFMASVLTSEKADVERIAFLIDECKKMKIEVLPPNINESLKNFTVVPGDTMKIRFGLLAIKNVGENIIDEITQEKKENGRFASIKNFLERVVSKGVNKKSMEALIKAGAFDEIAERNQLLSNMERMLEYSKEIQKAKNNSQMGLFGAIKTEITGELKLEPAMAASNMEKLSWEKELLGLYITSHPLTEYKKFLEGNTFALYKVKDAPVEKKVRVGGLIASTKKIITKTGKPMIFMKLEDLTDKAEIVVFPFLLERNPNVFVDGKIVFVNGRIDNRNGEVKIIADEVEEIVTS